MSDNPIETTPAEATDPQGVTVDAGAPTPEDYAALEGAIRPVLDTDEKGVHTTDTPDDDSPDGGDIAKARRQAAKYRTALRDTEAERDQLRAQYDSQTRAVIDWRAANHPGGAVDPALLDAAGIDVAELVDDNGHLDMQAVDAFITAAAQRFSVRRAFTPNRAQGISGDAGTSRPSLADAFRRR